MQSISMPADFGRQLPLTRLPRERWLDRGYLFPGKFWNNAVADPDLADFAAQLELHHRKLQTAAYRCTRDLVH